MIQKLTFNPKKEEGFTLVELLIVVAIIAILAAIAIPQFSAYRKRGYAATVNSDTKNVFTASQAYLTDDSTATVTLAMAQTAGYTPTVGVSCTPTSFTVSTGSWACAGASAWGVSTATITYTGLLTKSLPL